MSARERAHRIVIVGGGFGGLHSARELRGAPVEITLIDRRNFHLFQPLTYQVATGALSPGEVAYPLRAVFKRNRNVRVLLAEVDRFDLERREVVLRSVGDLPAPEPVPYDTLIVAGGSHYSYFGHDDWSAHAAEVKSLESALTVRSRILAAFEAVELERDPERRSEYLTFVVVGAGPTGVEIAGQIAELARDTLRRDFRTADPGSGRILLVEAADRVLTGFPPSLSAKAERSLRRLGVTPMLDSTVVDVDETGVTLQDADGATRRIPARTVVWAAGVTASGLAGQLAELTGAEKDRAGRVTVEADLTLPGHPEVFALGDMVRVRGRDGTAITFPGVAPVAIRQGRYAAKAVRARLKDRAAPPFGYHDKGNLATIGRTAAVADIKGIKAQRLPRLDDLAARAPLLFGGLPEPAARAHRLVHQLRHSRPRRPAQHESHERRRCRPSGGASRTIDASKRGLAAPMTGARKEPVVFVELDTRQDADDTVSLEWDRDTGETQIVVADIRDESLLVFPVPGANAGEAFRHPFRNAR